MQTYSPDPALQSAAEALTRDIFEHIAQGDIVFMARSACDDAVLYDLDPDGQPITARGRAAIEDFLAMAQRETSSGTAQVATAITRVEARAMVSSALCAVEYEQTVTFRGRTMGPFKFRGTLVFEEHEDGLRWSHYHGSFLERPRMPGPPPPAPPPGT